MLELLLRSGRTPHRSRSQTPLLRMALHCLDGGLGDDLRGLDVSIDASLQARPLAAAQAEVERMGLPAAAAAACAQFEDANTGGVLMERNPYETTNGVYALLGVDRGWPHFQVRPSLHQ